MLGIIEVFFEWMLDWKPKSAFAKALRWGLWTILVGLLFAVAAVSIMG